MSEIEMESRKLRVRVWMTEKGPRYDIEVTRDDYNVGEVGNVLQETKRMLKDRFDIV